MKIRVPAPPHHLAALAELRAIRDGACRTFGAVLSPDYNAAHADHLHLDHSPHHLCR